MDQFPRIGHLWEDISRFIIRPQRAVYDPEELGPEVFRLSKSDKRQFKREDIVLENMRGMSIRCTWFYPNHFYDYQDEEKDAAKKKRNGASSSTPSLSSSNQADASSTNRDKTLPCVVYLHGNCGSRCDALEILHLLGKGFTLFCYDACGSGMSDGEFVTLGFYERQDLATVIEFINESKRASTIGLWGRSMGAVTAIMYAARDPISIKALVLDSPFSQLRRLILDLVKQHASFMPEAWTSMAVKKIRKKVARMAQFDIDDLDAVKYGQQCSVPTFIFHGEDDDFVLPYHSQMIADNYKGMCFHHIVEGGHNSFRKNDVMNVAIPHLELYLIAKPDDEKARREARLKKEAEEKALLSQKGLALASTETAKRLLQMAEEKKRLQREREAAEDAADAERLAKTARKMAKLKEKEKAPHAPEGRRKGKHIEATEESNNSNNSFPSGSSSPFTSSTPPQVPSSSSQHQQASQQQQQQQQQQQLSTQTVIINGSSVTTSVWIPSPAPKNDTSDDADDDETNNTSSSSHDDDEGTAIATSVARREGEKKRRGGGDDDKEEFQYSYTIAPAAPSSRASPQSLSGTARSAAMAASSSASSAPSPPSMASSPSLGRRNKRGGGGGAEEEEGGASSSSPLSPPPPPPRVPPKQPHHHDAVDNADDGDDHYHLTSAPPSTCRAEDEDTDDDETFNKEFEEAVALRGNSSVASTSAAARR